jgi:hypothetical protein
MHGSRLLLCSVVFGFESRRRQGLSSAKFLMSDVFLACPRLWLDLISCANVEMYRD